MAVRNSRSDKLRRYPQLLSLPIALMIAAFVLPSSLNVPQTNPSETLEFAPVPPTDEDAPPVGNTGSLGLGSSGTTEGDGEGFGELPPPPPLLGEGTVPRGKKCVGNPPRQTEDPLSPPCVAFFDGDNGGATYQGVTRDEIRIIVYLGGNVWTTTDYGTESEANHAGECFDMAEAPQDQETVTRRNIRRWQRYFGERYQTYGRLPHFYVCIGTGAQLPSTTVQPEQRLADAAAHYARYKPFAVVTSGLSSLETVYTEAMAKKGVLSFGSLGGSRDASYYKRYPGRIWSYAPTVERRADLISSYICTKIVGHPVADSGNGDVGKPRKLGFLSTTDDRFPNLIRMADLVKKQVERCGGRFAATGTFPQHGAVAQSRGSDQAASYARTNMATFQAEGVTTIIWPGGYEADHSKAANEARYYPEIILGGDGLLEGQSGGSLQEQNVWRHAYAVSNVVLQAPASEDPCGRSLREADPNTGTRDTNTMCGYPYYNDLRQLFTGIQVAGPKLTPQSIDAGFHAIPGVPSSSVKVPACFYEPGDYTCVKDATAMEWDPDRNAPGATTTGCWRMLDGGRRYLVRRWPKGNITAQGPSGVCNSYSGAVLAF